tara:strand:+ start:321 stop:590 length:270 start_codon:yes stop_codon:yes gene_type:complete
MAKCIHGNDINQCGFCYRNRTIEQFGGHHNGDVTVSKQNGGLTKLYVKEAMEEHPPQERKEKEEEMMKVYVEKSFSVDIPETSKDDDNG